MDTCTAASCSTRTGHVCQPFRFVEFIGGPFAGRKGRITDKQRGAYTIRLLDGSGSVYGVREAEIRHLAK